MGFVVNTTGIEPPEVCARLNQRRDAAREPIAFRVSFAKLSREQIGQLDLADLAFDFIISHVRFEVMLETVFSEKLNKEFLRQVCVGRATSLFDQQAGAA